METFDNHLLADVKFNEDGSLKQSGKQSVKFYTKERMAFKARPLWEKDEHGEIVRDTKGRPKQARDEKGKLAFDIDPRTGIPYKDGSPEVVEMIRVETKGDPTIKEDIADLVSKRQFSRQYAYFRSGKIPDGTRIEDFEFIQPQTCEELHVYGIHTIEQVFEMNEVTAEQIRSQSGWELKEAAGQWIHMNSPHAKLARAEKLALENASLKAQLEIAKSGNRRKRLVEQEPVIEAPPVEDEPTNEISAEEFSKRRGRQRSV